MSETSQSSGLSQRLAIFIALLSTLTTIMTYHDSMIQSRAVLLKNEALIAQTQASGLWSYYQAKNSKENMVQLISNIAPDRASFYHDLLARYQAEENQIRQQAKSLEISAQENNIKSYQLTEDHQEGKGILLMQIAISLASISALTKKKWLFGFAGLTAIVGILLSLTSWIF